MFKTTAGLCAGLLLLFTLCSAVQANTIWHPTASGNDINVYYTWTTDITFAIFDASADIDTATECLIVSDPSPFLFNGMTFYSDTIHFNPNGLNWDIHSTETNNSLTLMGSNNFQLALWDESNWIEPTAYVVTAAGQYVISWDNDATLQVGAEPVPVPAAIYLLGAGLIALAGFKNHKS